MFRCLANGTEDLTGGTYISAKGTFAYSSAGGHNSLTKAIQYRQNGASGWNEGQADPADATAYVFGAGGISIAYAYEVRFSMSDLVGNTATFSVLVKTGAVLLHVRNGGKGLGVGGAGGRGRAAGVLPDGIQGRTWIYGDGRGLSLRLLEALLLKAGFCATAVRYRV